MARERLNRQTKKKSPTKQLSGAGTPSPDKPKDSKDSKEADTPAPKMVAIAEEPLAVGALDLRSMAPREAAVPLARIFELHALPSFAFPQLVNE